jgi:ATP/maltotriose-dependent transcriptional regulator MalT
VIAAGAGYGKTTLLWQWEREVDFPIYWYKLDRNDRDWTLHISYLIEAIEAFELYREDAQGYVRQVFEDILDDDRRHAERLLEALRAELR